MDSRHIVIFDGVCNFCNGSVKFIVNRDPEGIFAFTPVQSEVAEKLMNDHQLNTIEIDTFVLIKNGRAHVRSDAALEITKNLSGLWYLFNVFRIIPSPVRDFFYRLFARHRYQLFGKKDQCMIPDEDLKARFLSDSSP